MIEDMLLCSEVIFLFKCNIKPFHGMELLVSSQSYINYVSFKVERIYKKRISGQMDEQLIGLHK